MDALALRAHRAVCTGGPRVVRLFGVVRREVVVASGQAGRKHGVSRTDGEWRRCTLEMGILPSHSAAASSFHSFTHRLQLTMLSKFGGTTCKPVLARVGDLRRDLSRHGGP